jgi:hypothetical protein
MCGRRFRAVERRRRLPAVVPREALRPWSAIARPLHPLGTHDDLLGRRGRRGRREGGHGTGGGLEGATWAAGERSGAAGRARERVRGFHIHCPSRADGALCQTPLACLQAAIWLVLATPQSRPLLGETLAAAPGPPPLASPATAALCSSPSRPRPPDLCQVAKQRAQPRTRPLPAMSRSLAAPSAPPGAHSLAPQPWGSLQHGKHRVEAPGGAPDPRTAAAACPPASRRRRFLHARERPEAGCAAL